mmetsp:Transcript_10619/g.15634  ORF Transcript_10619/g.15634 Transcript_10619/m.15634 type:complete len:115 (+) Transcript_10619:146-490(+)
MVYSIETIFTAMQESLAGSKFPAKVVIMNVDGKVYRVDGALNTVTLCSEGEKGDLNVKTTLKILLSLLDKTLTPQQAFMKGMLKIKGSMGLAMKLSLIVNATRKQLVQERNSKL